MIPVVFRNARRLMGVLMDRPLTRGLYRPALEAELDYHAAHTALRLLEARRMVDVERAGPGRALVIRPNGCPGCAARLLMLADCSQCQMTAQASFGVNSPQTPLKSIEQCQRWQEA